MHGTKAPASATRIPCKGIAKGYCNGAEGKRPPVGEAKVTGKAENDERKVVARDWLGSDTDYG